MLLVIGILFFIFGITTAVFTVFSILDKSNESWTYMRTAALIALTVMFVTRGMAFCVEYKENVEIKRHLNYTSLCNDMCNKYSDATDETIK